MSESTPRLVSVAYWIWVVCAAAMVFLGLLAMTTSADAIEERLGSDADSFVGVLRGIGIASLLFGLVIGFLAAPVRAGNPRLRNVVVLLSAVFAVAAIALSTVGVIAPVLLVVPLLLVVACILVFREGAREWFRRRQSD
ncbi:hypothetical protein [Rhodococcus spongiicola]|uniref:Uncharacterized protein n=1 Tax=Rhodococcus spongiicola TaxID=2487352 RepID=A0A438AT30_9NOCA|nr:hypothetical protein [Rhodococcus spongiicola]RVW01820.1 hypothetical protein EF834_14225 [Rhodococcus spongiicola]